MGAPHYTVALQKIAAEQGLTVLHAAQAVHTAHIIKSLQGSMTLLHSIPILLLNGLTEIFRCCLQW